MVDRHATSAKLKLVLEQLGNTANEVATSLRRAGVRGRQRHIRLCPVARLLRRHFGRALAGPISCGIGGGGDTAAIVVDTPAAVEAFMYAFDDGCYPDLVG